MTQMSMFDAPNGDLSDAVGCGVYHKGEHGVIEAYLPDTYACPMFVVRFGTRQAVLKPSELGAQ